jgi:HEAT repeat protein
MSNGTTTFTGPTKQGRYEKVDAEMTELSKMLRSDNIQEFNEALRVLLSLPREDAVQIAEDLTRESVEEYRCRGLAAMAKIAPERAEALAIHSLSDVDPLVRVNAIDVLRRLGSRRSVRSIAELLGNDPDDLVRSWAAFALGEIGDTSVLDVLIAALGDEGTDHEGRPIRETAEQSIAKLRSRAGQE